jgi:hypothetical protein
LYLHAVDEHAEVLADRDQRRVLVVKLHAQRSVHRLRDFGNYNPAFVMLQGGLEQAETALIAGIEGGLTYFSTVTSARSAPARMISARRA